MIKKIFTFLLIAAVLLAAWSGFRFLGPATHFAGKEKYLLIYSNAPTRDAVLATLEKDSLVKNINAFSTAASWIGYWEKIKPGRYRITKGMSVTAILRQVRNGSQTPSRLVINKLRLPGDLAKVLSRAIESDSATIAAFLNNKDSLATCGLTPENWPASIIPNTYEVYWTTSITGVLNRLKDEKEKWWAKNDRKAKAEAIGLSPEEVQTLASIVEEESNVKADRPKIASVYLNRLKKGMPLQADPTIRFALKDFSLNRIFYGHLKTPSPYNTYLNRGLPPGPICTPSPTTIDNVLEAPKTDYIFFVANADLKGGSTFTTNLADHSRAAKLYQDSLTAWLKRKAEKEKNGSSASGQTK